jgi:hypothetical protein
MVFQAYEHEGEAVAEVVVEPEVGVEPEVFVASLWYAQGAIGLN